MGSCGEQHRLVDTRLVELRDLRFRREHHVLYAIDDHLFSFR